MTITLHWLIAFLVIGMLIFGFLINDIPKGPSQTFAISLHKSIGLTILLLMLFRFVWRYLSPIPALPITVAMWEQKAARAVHVFLYLALFLMPISGWMMSSLGGHPVMFWGWFNAAVPVVKNEKLADNFFTAHEMIAFIIIGLLVLHMAAALKHHFIEKNNVLRRMLPGYKSLDIFKE